MKRREILPDVLAPGLALVICGTAPGRLSAAAGAYYAAPGNKFWPILYASGLTPRLLAPAEFRELPKYGIGLTDVEKTQFGSDADIRFARKSARVLREKIERFAPAYLCFDSKRAAKEYFGVPRVEYGVQAERIGRTILFVAPSTSGLAIRAWDARIWEDLAVLVRRARAKQRGRTRR